MRLLSSLFKERKNFYKLNFEGNNREYFIYKGEFKDDKFHGHGDVHFRNKFHYEGKFVNNNITDQGVYDF